MRISWLKGRVIAGVVISSFVVGGIGAAMPSADGEVTAAGAVAPGPNARSVLHPVGGIVAEIRHRDGEHVVSGEVLARLEDAEIRTNLDLTTKNIDGLIARRARLEAERDGENAIRFPDDIIARAKDEDVSRALTSERILFEARSAARRWEKELRQRRIALIEDEIQGYLTQLSSKEREVTLIQRELDGVRQLRDQKLAPLTRLTQLERDAVRVGAEQRGAIPISIAQAKGRIADLELQIMLIERDRSREIASELSDVDARMDEDVRRKVKFEDELRRAEIRAPQDGIIRNSVLRAVGNEISAGEPLMLVVPASERPTVEARISPVYVSRLKVGQDATLETRTDKAGATKFTARLDAISPRAVSDASTGHDYYTARFEVMSECDQACALTPGEPVEISIDVGKPTLLDELVKPLDSLAEPLRQRLALVL